MVLLLRTAILDLVLRDPQTVNIFAPAQIPTPLYQCWELQGSKNTECLGVLEDWVGKHWLRKSRGTQCPLSHTRPEWKHVMQAHYRMDHHVENNE